MRKNFLWFILVSAFIVGSLFVSCSNGSDGGDTQSVVETGNGGTETTPNPTPTPTPAPTLATYTVTFNANDGSQSPATKTQSFTAGTPQNLKTIAELGFTKSGFNFAGWGTVADASESSYADGNSYTATSDAILYALWSVIPIYRVKTSENEHGTVTATPATATAGTKITLSNTPNAGYQFVSYTVTDADGKTIAVANGKFIMPAKNVTVTATFDAINYNINVGIFTNGSVTASPTTATLGTSVTLAISPARGYGLATLVVTDEGGDFVPLSGTGNSRTFLMPAKNVTVAATFNVVKYTVNVGTFANGSVTATPATATVGTSVTLMATPSSGYWLSTLTVNDESGTSISLGGTGNSRTFTMPSKNVVVTAIFSALQPAASGVYEKNGTTTINGIEYDLVSFGLWPQTIKADIVTVNESETEIHGDFIYCKGSDGQWYVKQTEKAYKSEYKYSDGTNVAQGGTSYKWFRVEPIKWRVLTRGRSTYYGGTKLYLAENILIAKRYDVSKNNYQNSEIRKWLNSNAASAAVSDHGDSVGFLKTAFTTAQIDTISGTSVNNNARSTNTDAKEKQWNNGNNQYASDTKTTDKVFLLSEQEATSRGYGFAVYDACGAGNARIRVTTDFAKASGACQSMSDSLGGSWWLRSPDWELASYARLVDDDGYTDSSEAASLGKYVGVVPALCLDN